MTDQDNDYQRAPSKKRKTKKVGCLFRAFRKLFIYLYPAQNKNTYTKEGDSLRCQILAALVLHTIFAIISLAFIGFEPMIVNMWLMILCYSCYITIRDCTIVLYLICLCLAISGGLSWGFSDQNQGALGLQSTQTMGLIANCVMLAGNCFLIFKSYMRFRATGGLRGLNPT